MFSILLKVQAGAKTDIENKSIFPVHEFVR